MDTKINKDATLVISFIRSKPDERNEIKDIPTLNAIKAVVDSFIETIDDRYNDAKIQ